MCEPYREEVRVRASCRLASVIGQRAGVPSPAAERELAYPRRQPAARGCALYRGEQSTWSAGVGWANGLGPSPATQRTTHYAPLPAASHLLDPLLCAPRPRVVRGVARRGEGLGPAATHVVPLPRARDTPGAGMQGDRCRGYDPF